VVEEAAQQAEEQEEATGFSAVVQRLLHRAASSLTRGTTTCLSCKGQGTCTCPACHVSSCHLSWHVWTYFAIWVTSLAG
jgi:hypothetical protein